MSNRFELRRTAISLAYGNEPRVPKWVSGKQSMRGSTKLWRQRVREMSGFRHATDNEIDRFAAKPVYNINLGVKQQAIKKAVSAQSFGVTFSNPEFVTEGIVRNSLRSVIRKYVDNNNLKSNDLIRLIAIMPPNNTEIYQPRMMRVDNIDLNEFMNIVDMAVQSNDDNNVIDGDIGHVKYRIIAARMPSGAGYLKSVDDIYKKKCIVKIKNSDNLCLARSIVVARARHEKHPKYKQIANHKAKIQLALAEKLHSDANIPLDKESYDIADVLKFSETISYTIVLLNTDKEIIYDTENGHDKIYLLKTQNHFDVITSMTAFMCYPYYCKRCHKGYKNRDSHLCDVSKRKCNMCKKITCDGWATDIRYPTSCDTCNVTFPTKECCKYHVCGARWKCSKCMRTFVKRTIKGEPHPNNEMDTHICGNDICTNCGKYVNVIEHKCYIQEYEPKAMVENVYYFDFEAQQETGTHIVNLSVTQDLEGNTTVHNNIDEFCEWAITKEHMDENAVFVAHNGSGYDFQFILAWCIEHKYAPYTIYNGGKLMCMTIGNNRRRIKFIDSLSFIMRALADMPKMFGISELKKGYFPHFFNTAENANYVGKYPPKDDYGYNQMSKKKRDDFIEWYNGKKKEVFDMKKEILEYCISDVDILRRCFEKFRKMFIELENIDPLNQITIASTVMKLYRAKYMPKDSIAVLKEVHEPETHSRSAMEWLEYMQLTNPNLNIEHAFNGGEHIVEYTKFTPGEGTDCARDGTMGRFSKNNYFLDGYAKYNDIKYAFEFNGCYFHGCDICYKDNMDMINKKKNKTMRQLNRETKQKRKLLERKGYKVFEMRECKWKNFKQNNKAAISKIDMSKCVTPLNPRDALYGGRTNACKLFWEAHDGKYARYNDITSLYPTVNFYDRYPVGHPEIIKEPNINKLLNREYYGLVKCRIAPPTNIYHPVLPAKINGKLTFTLCMRCANENNNKECNHSLSGRALYGTWASPEIYLALDNGYQIIDLYEIWHFENSSNDLFKQYVSRFLKIKQEASGYPAWVKNDSDKKKYIDDYYEKMGIRISDIEKNNGLRAFAKLCLNSLWGKFGQNPDMPCTEFIRSERALCKLLTNPTIKNININIINQNCIEVSYNKKKPHIEDQHYSNIVVALFTTANARCRLYKELKRLDRQVIYYDTDSIVYEDGKESITLGDNLGDWTDELDGYKMVKFVSGGPKNYAYVLDNGKSKAKIKGISLNYENSEIFSIGAMYHVIRYGLNLPPLNQKNSATITTKNKHKITRDKKEKCIKSEYMEKIYKYTYSKRRVIITNDLIDTLPFGYSTPREL